MLDALYAEYIKERLNRESFVIAEVGFATYSFVEDECQIHDIYIRPEYRRDHNAFSVGDKVAEIAKAKGCKKLVGFCDLKAQNPEASIVGQIKYGFKIIRAHDNYLVFVKDI